MPAKEKEKDKKEFAHLFTPGPNRPCGLCGQPVEDREEEDYLHADCSVCGDSEYHLDCVADFLEDNAAGKTNSILRKKLKVRSKRRPQEEFTQKRCPVGVYLGHWEGTGTGRHWEGPVCGGQIKYAEWVRAKPTPPPAPAAAATPAAAPAAPRPKPAPTQQPKAATTKQSQQAKAAGGAAAGSAKATLAQQREQVAALRQKSSNASSGAQPSASGRQQLQRQSSAVGARPDRPKFDTGQRPPGLRMCINWTEYGDCHVYNCKFAHGEEDLARREAEWREEQEQVKQERKHQEREQQRAALEDHIWNQEALIPLSQEAFAALKRHKLSHCVASLVDMGFEPEASHRASAASGGNVAGSVAILTNAALPPPKGTKRPVDVHREAESLLQAASSLGFTAAAVEAQLLSCGGDWEAAEQAFEAQATARQQVEEECSQADAGGAQAEAWSGWGTPRGGAEASKAGMWEEEAPAAVAPALGAAWQAEGSWGEPELALPDAAAEASGLPPHLAAALSEVLPTTPPGEEQHATPSPPSNIWAPAAAVDIAGQPAPSPLAATAPATAAASQLPALSPYFQQHDRLAAGNHHPPWLQSTNPGQHASQSAGVPAQQDFPPQPQPAAYATPLPWPSHDQPSAAPELSLLQQQQQLLLPYAHAQAGTTLAAPALPTQPGAAATVPPASTAYSVHAPPNPASGTSLAGGQPDVFAAGYQAGLAAAMAHLGLMHGGAHAAPDGTPAQQAVAAQHLPAQPAHSHLPPPPPLGPPPPKPAVGANPLWEAVGGAATVQGGAYYNGAQQAQQHAQQAPPPHQEDDIENLLAMLCAAGS